MGTVKCVLKQAAKARNEGIDISDKEAAIIYDNLKEKTAKIPKQQKQSVINKMKSQNIASVDNEIRTELISEISKKRLVNSLDDETPLMSLEAKLGGRNERVKGFRDSIDNDMDSIKKLYIKRLMIPLEDAGILNSKTLKNFEINKFDYENSLKEIYNISAEDSIRFNDNERKLMAKGEKIDLMEGYDPEISGDPEAFAVAKLASKINMEMQERYNRTARFKKTYDNSDILKASYDPKKMKDTGFNEWKKKIYPLLNEEKTFQGKILSDEEKNKILENIFDKYVYRGKLSNEISDLYFKDAASHIEYNNLFGNGRSIYTNMEKTITEMSRDIALHESFGPKPYETFLKVRDDLHKTTIEKIKFFEKELNGLPDKKSKPAKVLKKKIKQLTKSISDTEMDYLDKLFKEVSGMNIVPVISKLGTTMKTIRQAKAFASLTYAGLRSIGDIGGVGGELRYQTGSQFKAFTESANALKEIMKLIYTAPRNSADHIRLKQLSREHGFDLDFLSGSNTDRFNFDDISILTEYYYKLTGLSAVDSTNRRTLALEMSKLLGEKSNLKFSELDERMTNMLDMQNIGEKEWDFFRSHAEEIDGNVYVTPESIRWSSDESILKYANTKKVDTLADIKAKTMEKFPDMTEENVEKISVAEFLAQKNEFNSDIKATRDLLETKLQNYYTDRSNFGVVTPTGKERLASNWGTKPGTKEGEFMRSLMLFKSYIISLTKKPLGRDIVGGFGKLDTTASLASTALIYTTGTILINQIVSATKGEEPPLYTLSKKMVENGRFDIELATKIVTDAFLQVGLLGMGQEVISSIFSSFGSFVEVTAGPIGGLANDTAEFIKSLYTGKKPAKKALKIVKGAVPSLPIEKALIDGLIWDNLNEAVDPGYKRRKKNWMKKDKRKPLFD